MILGAVWGLLTGTRLLRGEEDSGRWELLLAGQTTRGRRRRPGARRPRRGRRRAVGGHRGHHRPHRARTSKVNIARRAGALLRPGHGGHRRSCSWPSARSPASLAPTRRQAASYAAAFLGVCYAVRMVADAGVGLHGLIWASPLGWVEELRPLTAPAAAGAGAGRRLHRGAGRRRGAGWRAGAMSGRASCADRATSAAAAAAAVRARRPGGPADAARPSSAGGWRSPCPGCCSGSSPSRPAARSRGHR